jgi:hypothetical protein
MKDVFKVLHEHDFTEEVTASILRMGIKSGTWKTSDIEYYTQHFTNARNIHVVYYDKEGVIAGYIMAMPHADAVKEYAEEDPEMQSSIEAMFYVDHLNVDESAPGKSLWLRLFLEMTRGANRRNVYTFSMHCRTVNGLSRVVRKKFKDGIKVVRRIDNYVDCNNEPFDYMESPVNPERFRPIIRS